MKIVMVHPHDLWYDPWTIRILELGRGLMRRGHDVTLCHLPRKERPDHEPLRKPQPGDPPIYDLLPRQKHFVHNMKLLMEIARDCDILHLQKCFAATALPLLWVTRKLGKPLHYDWDDDETAISEIVEKRFWARYQLAIYERMLPSFASTLTYASQAIKDRALVLGVAEERMLHLPVGADIERFSPMCETDGVLESLGLKADRPTVLYIGQLEGAAQANRFIEIAPLVCQKVPQAQFLIVGGGEQLESVRDLAKASEVASSIHVVGYVTSNKIPAIIASSDVCVATFDDTPAARAKSPLKIAEYLASGKPIVASDVGDVRWMLGDSGIAVKPGSVEAMAEGILIYLCDADRRTFDGQKARQRAEEHLTWDHGCDVLLRAYTQCLA